MATLKQMLAAQRQELKAREEAIQQYKATQIGDREWRGFWSFYRSNVNGFRDMYIEQEKNGSIVGRWFEGGKMYVMEGKLSPSGRLLEGATVHTPFEGNRFITPMSCKLGAGHNSISACFDWKYFNPRPGEECIFSRQHPRVVALYTTGASADGRPGSASAASASAVTDDETMSAVDSAVGIDELEAEHFQLGPGGEVRTRRLLSHYVVPMKRIANLVLQRSPQDFALAPVTTTADVTSHSGANVVLRSQYKTLLETDGLATHWCEGGLYNNDEYAAVTKRDLELLSGDQDRYCLIPSTMRGVAQLRQQKVHTLFVHIELLAPSRRPASAAAVAPPAVVEDAVDEVTLEDVKRKVNIVEAAEVIEPAEADAAIAGDEESKIGLIDQFVLPPQKVDCFLTLNGTFTSEEKAAAALEDYLRNHKPVLLR